MTVITIVVPGQPVAKGRPIAGKAFGTNFTTMRTPKKTLIYENYVKQCAVDTIKDMLPLEGAVRVEITVMLAALKSFSKIKMQQALDGYLRPVTRPDIDNYIKAALDGINGVVFLDDSQVTDIIARKRYGQLPRLIIKVQKVLENETF